MQNLPTGLTHLDIALPNIRYEAKYATEDNFTGIIVDGYNADRVVISQAMIEPLETAAELASNQGYFLFVWDAVRPQRAVDAFIVWLDSPENGKTKPVFYPNLSKKKLTKGYIAKRSGHSRGCAIDLTLIDERGQFLDMGSDFDLMDPRSHHGAAGLTAEQTANRKALKKIMEQAGFTAYEKEWWHYILRPEPFPDTYFDFSIEYDAPDPE